MKKTPAVGERVVVTNDPDKLVWTVEGTNGPRVGIRPLEHHPKEAVQWTDRSILSRAPA